MASLTAKHVSARRIHTANRGLLVLLEVVVNEAHDE
jgi:hypothetical protein